MFLYLYIACEFIDRKNCSVLFAFNKRLRLFLFLFIYSDEIFRKLKLCLDRKGVKCYNLIGESWLFSEKPTISRAFLGG